MSSSPGFKARRPVSLSTPAFLRRFASLLLASVLLLLLAGSALASIDAPRPVIADTFTSHVWNPAELPDVAVMISGVDGQDPTLERLVIPALRDLSGVQAVAAERTDTGQVALHVSLSDDAPDSMVSVISSLVATSLPEANVALGGRIVADQDVLARLNRGTIVAVVPVIVLFTVLIAVAFGLNIGSAAGGSVGLATLLGGLVGSQVAGRFDGSIATTAVPAVLVAVLVSSVLTLRLLEWFKEPVGLDPADTISNAIRHLIPEMVLLFSGLLVTTLVLEAFGSGRSSALVVTAGGFVAAIVTLSILPALLSTWERVPARASGLLSSEVPDGRDFPIPVLGGFACFLLALGLFSIRTPTSELLDESALAPAVSSRRVSDQLIDLGGDPTSAVLAQIPSTATEAELTTWSTNVSNLAMVGWVQTSVGRFSAGERTGESDAELFIQGDSIVAIVTPTVTTRSDAAHTLVTQLERSGGDVFDVALSGEPVRSAAVSDTATSRLWLLVGLLAVAGGLTIMVLIRDAVMALATVALRFLGIGAALGVYRIVAGDVDSAELQITALVLSVGIGLFEIGFVRRLVHGLGGTNRLSVEKRSELVTSALHREGRAAIFGLVITALCGLGYMAGDLEVARRLGVAIATAVFVEILVGSWLLRPVVLGQRMVGSEAIETPEFRLSLPRRSQRKPDVPATTLDMLLALGQSEPTGATAIADPVPAAHSASAPVTDKVERAGFRRRDSTDSSDWREMTSVGRPLDTFAEADQPDAQWRRVVSGLLRTEFSFQINPSEAELETVFVADTPLYSELESHNLRLRKAGLTVAGDGPELFSVAAVNDSSPVTLAITVDHPERRLYDATGKLLGIRSPERRHGMLWLVQDPSGRYRIAEAVDLGSGEDADMVDQAVENAARSEAVQRYANRAQQERTTS